MKRRNKKLINIHLSTLFQRFLSVVAEPVWRRGLACLVSLFELADTGLDAVKEGSSLNVSCREGCAK